MADSKSTALSINITARDRASAVIHAINARIKAVASPMMNVAKGVTGAIGSMMSGVSSVLGSVFEKVALVGTAVAGLVVGAVAGLVHLVDKFDDLGKKSERLGVGVDFLADLRFAAEKTGAPIEALDEGLQSFSQNLGQARAGTGRMLKFLNLVSPALAQQLKGAKSNEAAFLLLADAMAKLQDPAKRAALAQKTVGDAALAPLLARGAAGIKDLTDQHAKLTGSLTGAAAASAEAKEAMIDLHAAVDGAEAGIVVGLAPALKIIVAQLSEWFVAHRSDIAEFAKTLGEKIPGAFKAVVDGVGWAIKALGKFFGLLEDIYDKIKEITHLNDAEYQAKKFVEGVPVEKAGQVADAVEAQGMTVSAAHRTALSAIGGLFGMSGLADTDVGRQATENFLGEAGAAVGVNTGFTSESIYSTGFYERELAKQLRAKAAGAVKGQAADAAGAAAGGQAPAKADITVTIANAPRGTRVQTDPGSTADVDLKVGYQLFGW